MEWAVPVLQDTLSPAIITATYVLFSPNTGRCVKDENALMCFWTPTAKKQRETGQTYRDHIVDKYGDIYLCDISHFRRNTKDFIDCTKKALELIERNDLRRFRRIRRYFVYIVNDDLIEAGNYDLRQRACSVDFSFFKVRDEFEWYLLQYAGLLVHESTHGLIFDRQIPYTKRTRMRIERLCTDEERRFLKKVSPWDVEELIRDYDEKWLNDYWGFFSKLRLAWRRANEILDGNAKKR